MIAWAVSLTLGGVVLAQEAGGPLRIAAHIPAEGLGKALKVFAKESKLQILYRTKLVDGVKTRGASGDLTTNETLAQLLRGTGLTYRYVDQKTVTLQELVRSARHSGDR